MSVKGQINVSYLLLVTGIVVIAFIAILMIQDSLKKQEEILNKDVNSAKYKFSSSFNSKITDVKNLYKGAIDKIKDHNYGFRLQVISNDRVNLAWNALPTNDFGDGVLFNAYYVYMSKRKGVSTYDMVVCEIHTYNLSSCAVMDLNLLDSNYYFKLYACNNYGVCAESQEISTE
jgi:hypothetical protein